MVIKLAGLFSGWSHLDFLSLLDCHYANRCSEREFYPNPITPQYVANNPDKFVSVIEKNAYFLGMEDGMF